MEAYLEAFVLMTLACLVKVLINLQYFILNEDRLDFINYGYLLLFLISVAFSESSTWTIASVISFGQTYWSTFLL